MGSSPAIRLSRRIAKGLPALTAAGALFACAVTAAQPGGDELEPCADGVWLKSAVERLNALRQQSTPCSSTSAAAMRPLAWEAKLAASAYEQAVDLALNDRLSHVDARQRTFGVRLRSVGYQAAGAGENLAAGQTNLEDTLAAWLASPSHCANLMQPEYRDVGLACVQRRNSRYERFWVAHLGAPVRR